MKRQMQILRRQKGRRRRRPTVKIQIRRFLYLFSDSKSMLESAQQ